MKKRNKGAMLPSQTSLNIEDTGRLMTEAADGGRRKRLILISAAVIAVVVIAAVILIRTTSDRKYNDQIRIAEKALREGSYEQAESEYMKAVSMKRRNVKAREGLAFTYALETKFEEAEKSYVELYEETDEEKYRLAADSVIEGNIPSIDGIMPPDLWIKVDTDILPDSEEASEFLGKYCTWSYQISNVEDSGDYLPLMRYDSSDPGNSYVLVFARTYLPDSGEQILDNNDPRGWSEGGYQITPREDVERVMLEIFNADEDKMDTMYDTCERRGMIYVEGDNCYTFTVSMGMLPVEAAYSRLWINGSRYCIEYDALAATGGPVYVEGDPYIGTYYAVLENKDNSVAPGWTMHYNGEEPPEDLVSEEEEAEPEKPEEEPKPSVDTSDVYAAYADILSAKETEIVDYYVNYIGTDQCVALTDINEDGIEELLLIETPEEYAAGELHVWSYDPDQGIAVECQYGYSRGYLEEEGSCLKDVPAGGGTSFMVYKGREPGTMYIADFAGDEFSYYRMACFRMKDAYEMEEAWMVDNLVEPYYDKDEYRIGDEIVSRDEGIAKFKEGNTEYKSLIMSKGYQDGLSVFEHTKTDAPAAMTYYEALSRLQG